DRGARDVHGRRDHRIAGEHPRQHPRAGSDGGVRRVRGFRGRGRRGPRRAPRGVGGRAAGGARRDQARARRAAGARGRTPRRGGRGHRDLTPVQVEVGAPGSFASGSRGAGIPSTTASWAASATVVTGPSRAATTFPCTSITNVSSSSCTPYALAVSPCGSARTGHWPGVEPLPPGVVVPRRMPITATPKL